MAAAAAFFAVRQGMIVLPTALSPVERQIDRVSEVVIPTATSLEPVATLTTHLRTVSTSVVENAPRAQATIDTGARAAAKAISGALLATPTPTPMAVSASATTATPSATTIHSTVPTASPTPTITPTAILILPPSVYAPTPTSTPTATLTPEPVPPVVISEPEIGADDYFVLLDGVGEIGAPGVPGSLCVYGSRAFPVIVGATWIGDGQAPVMAASRWKEGRIVALGHDGYFTRPTLESADTGRMIANALTWASGEFQKLRPPFR